MNEEHELICKFWRDLGKILSVHNTRTKIVEIISNDKIVRFEITSIKEVE